MGDDNVFQKEIHKHPYQTLLIPDYLLKKRKLKRGWVGSIF